MNTSPPFLLVPVLFVVVAVGAAGALVTQRRRLGLALTVAGVALLAAAVVWTFMGG